MNHLQKIVSGFFVFTPERCQVLGGFRLNLNTEEGFEMTSKCELVKFPLQII